MSVSVPRQPAGLELLDKADALIRALEDQGTITVNALAETVGEPVSSVYRLLASLTALGWVERGPQRGTYRLGVYMLKVGGVCEDDLDLREAVRPVLQWLHEQTRTTCLLWVRRGQNAVCVDRIEGRALRLSGIRLGDSLPLDVAGGPRALLAHLPLGEREQVLADLVAATGPGEADRSARQALEELLREERARGWVSNERVPPVLGPAVAEFAAPVVNHRRELAGAIAVRGLRAVMLERESQMSRLVRQAATMADAALGAPAAQDCRA